MIVIGAVPYIVRLLYSLNINLSWSFYLRKEILHMVTQGSCSIKAQVCDPVSWIFTKLLSLPISRYQRSFWTKQPSLHYGFLLYYPYRVLVCYGSFHGWSGFCNTKSVLRLWSPMTLITILAVPCGDRPPTVNITTANTTTVNTRSAEPCAVESWF